MELARSRHLDAFAPIDFDAFAAALNGRLVRPGDDEYEEARLIQNRVFNRYPAAIVKAADASDVARTIGLARDTGLDLAVRGGGHSLAGHSIGDDAIVLDLSPMKALHIDPTRRLAWAQPGLTAGEVLALARDEQPAVGRHELDRHEVVGHCLRHARAPCTVHPGRSGR